MKQYYPFFISFFLLTFSISSQQNYWIETNFKDQTQGASLKNMDDSNYKTYQLDKQSFKKQLVGAPIRGQFRGKSNTLVSFPNENGKLERFRVIEAPVLSEELSSRYPNIKTYLGFSIDNPGTRIRFSVTPLGVNAMTSYTDREASFLIPATKISNGQYLVYTRAAKLNASKSFECLTEDTFVPKRENTLTNRDANDQILRILRIAISTTGEYTNFWDDGNAGNGDAQDDALAQVVSTLNRTNEVFEVDMAVTFTLVTGTEIIYPDASTDPYTGNLNSQLQSTLTSIVTEDKYDIGHLFDFGSNNGNAGCIGCVCEDGQKGSGFSSHTFIDNDGFSPYMSDFFDIDYVPHEIGHQMGANHTFSFDPEGSGVQSEPGSGTTIMGYAGITGSDDIQDHSEPYFHYHSIDQILDNLINVRTCWTSTAIPNNPPVANAGNDYTIPQGTAFILKGASTDADSGDTHTYTWEQIDNGVTTSANFGPTKTTGATWRSRPPSTSLNRYMPILSRVIAGQLTETNPVESVDNSTWETVSTVARDLNFALTVRDRSETNGIGQTPQSSFDTMTVTVDGNSGPFQLTSQTTNETWEIGSTQTVTWDVANTDIAPVNTANVNILLSIDGGLTFPFTLASKGPNNGSHDVAAPIGTTTTQARVIVEGAGNIFYAVNSTDFTIVNTEFLLVASNPSIDICQPDAAVYNFTYNTFSGFSETTVFSANNVPTGATVSFSPISASVDGTTVTMTISNTGASTVGNYLIRAIGTAPSETYSTDVTLNIFGSSINATTLVSPINGIIDLIPPNTTLSWVLDNNAQDYFIEIATDNGFSNIVDSATVQSSNYTTTVLISNTQYYWRVTASNLCATATASSIYSFITAIISCDFFTATDTPITIGVGGGNKEYFSAISVTPDLPILDVNVTIDITHTYDADLDITLTSPTGTVVALTSANGANGDNYTNTVFDQEGSTAITSGSPPFTGTFVPEGDLSILNGETSGGNWTLTVTDTAAGDGGSLDGFTLELCVQGTLSINETRFDKLTIFPNPNNGEFTVKLSSDSGNDIIINVYDIRGRKVFGNLYKNGSSNFNEVINLGNAQSELYLITISDGLKSQTKKIIIN